MTEIHSEAAELVYAGRKAQMVTGVNPPGALAKRKMALLNAAIAITAELDELLLTEHEIGKTVGDVLEGTVQDQAAKTVLPPETVRARRVEAIRNALLDGIDGVGPMSGLHTTHEVAQLIVDVIENIDSHKGPMDVLYRSNQSIKIERGHLRSV